MLYRKSCLSFCSGLLCNLLKIVDCSKIQTCYVQNQNNTDHRDVSRAYVCARSYANTVHTCTLWEFWWRDIGVSWQIENVLLVSKIAVEWNLENVVLGPMKSRWLWWLEANVRRTSIRAALRSRDSVIDKHEPNNFHLCVHSLLTTLCLVFIRLSSISTSSTRRSCISTDSVPLTFSTWSHARLSVCSRNTSFWIVYKVAISALASAPLVPHTWWPVGQVRASKWKSSDILWYHEEMSVQTRWSRCNCESFFG